MDMHEIDRHREEKEHVMRHGHVVSVPRQPKYNHLVEESGESSDNHQSEMQ